MFIVRFFLSVLFALCAGGFISSLSAAESDGAAEPITIGAMLSLTGDVASFGAAIQQGMELAMADGPAAEGLYASQIWVENGELERKYAAKYGQAANRLNVCFVSIGYAAVRCLSKLKSDLEARELPFASDTIKSGLAGFSCPGAAGPFTISAQGLSDKKEQIVVVKGGKIELAQ